eukprot:scaffold54301_cov69-Phaeocystis_antarctica.AAC.1
MAKHILGVVKQLAANPSPSPNPEPNLNPNLDPNPYLTLTQTSTLTLTRSSHSPPRSASIWHSSSRVAARCVKRYLLTNLLTNLPLRGRAARAAGGWRAVAPLQPQGREAAMRAHIVIVNYSIKYVDI